MFGPPENDPADMPAASHAADTTVPRSELTDITGGWKDRVAALAVAVAVPVHYRQGEHEKLWLNGGDIPERFGWLFSAEPRGRLRDGGERRPLHRLPPRRRRVPRRAARPSPPVVRQPEGDRGSQGARRDVRASRGSPTFGESMSDDVSELVARLEDQRFAAMPAGDAAALDPRLRCVHSSGATDGKASCLAAVADGAVRYLTR